MLAWRPVAILFSLCLVALASADRFDDWAKKQMEANHIPGMAIGVFRKGHAIKVGAYGYADLEQKVRVRRDSRFEVCSVTKQFTAAAILLLAEDGKLSLDDPVVKHLKEWPAEWSEITLRQLLNHTSGLNDDLLAFSGKPLSEELPALKKMLLSPPRTRMEYSNLGYLILGEVVARVSGKSYAAFLKERIFDPLGMKDTQTNVLETLTPNRVHGYGWSGTAHVNAGPLSFVAGGGAGSLISTVDDLGRWSEALMNGKLLKPQSRAAMLEPGKLVGGETAWPEGIGTGYGLGVFLDSTAAGRVEMHSGGWEDASCQLTRYVDSGYTIVVLTNLGGWTDRYWIGQALAHLVVKDEHPPLWEAAPADPDIAFTARLKLLVQSVVDKKPQQASFSDRFMAQCEKATTLSDIATEAKSVDLKSLKFVQKVPQGKGAWIVYRFDSPSPKVLFVRTDPDGRIGSFSVANILTSS
jgi:CubicO group peptidase (beta-lactamase class C family)